jgi:outer membrane protein assembly factor BamB
VKVGNEDVAWVTPLPSWGHCSPIVVQGPSSPGGSDAASKVFVQVEPWEGKRLFPALICVDAATGKILWEKELDQTLSLAPAEREEAIAAWKQVDADYAKRLELAQGYNQTKDEEPLTKAGYAWNARWSKVVPADKAHEGEIKSLLKTAKKAGFSLETWRHGCSGGSVVCIGQAHATPVSDGERVYVQTAWGGYFCFDLDGKLLWTVFSKGDFGEYCRNGRSPILWQNLLLSDGGNLVRAFDKMTGELQWSDNGPATLGKEGAHTIVSPAVITVDGQDILYAAGNQAYELPSGKKLAVEGWVDYGMHTMVKADEPDVVFFSGVSEHCGWTGKSAGIWNDPEKPVSPAAVRFKREGDTLKAEMLWDGRQIRAVNGLDDNVWAKGGKGISFLLGATYHDGKYYHPDGYILDAGTAKIIAGEYRGKTRAVPESQRFRFVADGHVWGYNPKGGKRKADSDDSNTVNVKISVCKVDGTPIAENVIELPAPTLEYDAARKLGGFGYSGSWTLDGAAIYLHGLDSLVRIGK